MQRIQSLGVLSCAKMMGVLYGGMGLLFVPLALVGGLASIATQTNQRRHWRSGHSRLRGPCSLSLRGHGVRVWRHRSMDL
jgi:hypothetical protein